MLSCIAEKVTSLEYLQSWPIKMSRSPEFQLLCEEYLLHSWEFDTQASMIGIVGATLRAASMMPGFYSSFIRLLFYDMLPNILTQQPHPRQQNK
jgi:hypothetical protein